MTDHEKLMQLEKENQELKEELAKIKKDLQWYINNQPLEHRQFII